ncbi:hypothetical protein I3760_09G150000 [Carya illinoinensis]|nr:hypothetical protein I3760_09G150000 [Carya illinoinensis]
MKGIIMLGSTHNISIFLIPKSLLNLDFMFPVSDFSSFDVQVTLRDWRTESRFMKLQRDQFELKLFQSDHFYFVPMRAAN